DAAISTTLRDLARFGEMIARGGATANGERVLSAAWVEDIFTGAADSAEVFAASASGRSYPGGMYRSQFWTPSADRNVVIGIGINAQRLCIDRATHTAGVRCSSDPEPVSLSAQHGPLSMFDAIAEAVPAPEAAPSLRADGGIGPNTLCLGEAAQSRREPPTYSAGRNPVRRMGRRTLRRGGCVESGMTLMTGGTTRTHYLDSDTDGKHD